MHVIRLREPWQVSREADHRVVLRRRFHCPTGLESGDRVLLVVEGLIGERSVTLNGNHLAMESDTAGTLRAEIHAQLIGLNEIVLELTGPDALVAQLRTDVLAAGLVRLEITKDEAGRKMTNAK
ncbi:MAG: hypothetical protein ACYC0X_01810 [Pirellulaceae bacterium]